MTFWNGERLNERLRDLVDPFREEAIDCAAYTLSIGREVYVSPTAEMADAKQQTTRRLSDGAAFTIPPGQFAFLLTEESVTVPNSAIAFISMKATIKFRGLINVSGFHIDPGFKGKLIFAVFNAGPATIHLKQGEDCFLVWYADLSGPSELVRRKPPQTGIPSEFLTQVSGELQSFEGLSARIKAAEKLFSERLQTSEKGLSDLEKRLSERWQGAETALTARVTATEKTLTDRIHTAETTVNKIANTHTLYRVMGALALLIIGAFIREAVSWLAAHAGPAPVVQTTQSGPAAPAPSSARAPAPAPPPASSGP
jgi:dCTP deaminase